jgi:hypothetical protein
MTRHAWMALLYMKQVRHSTLLTMLASALHVSMLVLPVIEASHSQYSQTDLSVVLMMHAGHLTQPWKGLCVWQQHSDHHLHHIHSQDLWQGTLCVGLSSGRSICHC